MELYPILRAEACQNCGDLEKRKRAGLAVARPWDEINRSVSAFVFSPFVYAVAIMVAIPVPVMMLDLATLTILLVFVIAATGGYERER